MLEIMTDGYEELVPLKNLESAQGSPEMKQSPNVSKNSKRSQQRQKQQIQILKDQPQLAPIPDPSANDCGTTDAVSKFLEVRDLYLRIEYRRWLTEHVRWRKP